MTESSPGRAALEALLAKEIRAWDRRRTDSCAVHGTRQLAHQEAVRLEQALSLLDGMAPPHRVMEIGTGYLTCSIALRHRFPEAELIGVEFPGRSYIWTPEYQARLAEGRIRLAAVDLARSGLPFRSETFDLVMCAEVLEHLSPDAVPGVLAETGRVLKPGGWMVVTTPNLAAWENRELVLRGHSPQQSAAMIIDGTYGHVRLYTMAELVALFRSTGFRVDRQAYADQVPVGISSARRLLRGLLWPVRRLRPALRDTCLVRAVRNGRQEDAPHE